MIGAAIGALRTPLGAHLRAPALVLPALGAGGASIHLALWLVPASWQGLLLVVSLGMLARFGFLNRHVVGMGVLTVGLSANLAVALGNGAMPVRARALVSAGIVEPGALASVDLGAGRRFEQAGDVFVGLADIIPVPLFGAVMSFGDLIVLMGVGTIAGELARRGRAGSTWSLLAAARRRLEAQTVIELGVGREETWVGERSPDVEELLRVLDLVDPEHRLGDQRRDSGDRRERTGVAASR